MPEKYSRLAQQIYEAAKIAIKSSVGLADECRVRVGLHQGLVVSSQLFDVIMDVMTYKMCDNLEYYVSGRATCESTRIKKCRRLLESRGLRLSRTKIGYLKTKECEGLKNMYSSRWCLP